MVPAPGIEQRQTRTLPELISPCTSWVGPVLRKPPFQAIHESKLDKSLFLPPVPSPQPWLQVGTSLVASIHPWRNLSRVFPLDTQTNNGPDSRSCSICVGFSWSQPVQGEFPLKSHLQPWQMCRVHGCHSTFILYLPLTGQANRIPDVSYPGARPKVLGIFSVVLGCSEFARLTWHWDIWREQLPANIDFFPPK